MKSQAQKKRENKLKSKQYYEFMRIRKFRLMCRWVHEEDWEVVSRYLKRKRKARENND